MNYNYDATLSPHVSLSLLLEYWCPIFAYTIVSHHAFPATILLDEKEAKQQVELYVPLYVRPCLYGYPLPLKLPAIHNSFFVFSRFSFPICLFSELLRHRIILHLSRRGVDLPVP
jgi:hypothetical protein